MLRKMEELVNMEKWKDIGIPLKIFLMANRKALAYVQQVGKISQTTTSRRNVCLTTLEIPHFHASKSYNYKKTELWKK
jgi:hypothetical protein